MLITLDTRLAEIGDYYRPKADPMRRDDALRVDIYDNLDVIGDDLIDASVVGYEWGEALDRVLRYYGLRSATVRHLREALLTQHARA
jgi:hypothetical protein